MHYFSNFFDKVLYMFRIGPLSITRSISTLSLTLDNTAGHFKPPDAQSSSPVFSWGTLL